MIRYCTGADVATIDAIINEAAQVYRAVASTRSDRSIFFETLIFYVGWPTAVPNSRAT
jgi:hypothetical protein